MHRITPNILAKDYLWPAVALSLLLHGALIGLFASKEQALVPRLSQHPTTIINYHTLETPEFAHRLAQWNAQGGGTAEQGLASSPLPSSGPLSIDNLYLQALQRQRQELEKQHYELLQQLKEQATQHSITAHTDEAPTLAPRLEQGDDTLSLIQKRLTELALQIEHAQQRPRYTFIGPSTLASPFAAYVQAWQAKIERIGTEHYPEQARGKASARLQITVYMNRHGEIEQIEFDQPATDPIFNLAARRIIHLAAPFAPFSPEMAQQTDILAITRTWHFEQGQLRTDTEQP